MKILFIYTPSIRLNPSGQSALFPMVMPLGLIPLAASLRDAGHTVQVIHTGIEIYRDPNFSLQETVGEFAPDALCLSLHFHHQIAQTGITVKHVRASCPQAHLIMGGMTASVFWHDAMSHWPELDYVVRGDADKPLPMLIKALERGSDPAAVPNLAYRRGNGIFANDLSYCADSSDLNALKCTELSLLRNYHSYDGAFLWPRMNPNSEKIQDRIFYLTLGRGCSGNCAYCSGAASMQIKISARRLPIMRSPDRVLADMQQAQTFGFTRFSMNFDPPGLRSEYFETLFAAVAASPLQIPCDFECFNRVPDSGFLSAFAGAFPPGENTIVLSPDTANENLRRFIKGASYRNNELETCLRQCLGFGLRPIVYFTAFPGETIKGFHKTLDWAERLREKYTATITFMPVEMEPMAPWHDHPENYSLRRCLQSFRDFAAYSQSRDFSRNPEYPGYDFPDLSHFMALAAKRGFFVSEIQRQDELPPERAFGSE